MKKLLTLCLLAFIGITSLNAQTVTTISTGFTTPLSVAIDNSGNCYVGNQSGAKAGVIEKITPSGTVTTFATGLSALGSVGVDNADNVFAGNSSGNFYKITQLGTVNVFATGASVAGNMQIESNGDIYAATLSTTMIKISSTGNVTTFASGLTTARGVAKDGSGNFYVCSQTNNLIYKITATGIVSTFATLQASSSPSGLVFDNAGNLYVAAFSRSTIYKIAPNGTVSTFATGISGARGIVYSPINNCLYCVAQLSGILHKITLPNTCIATSSSFTVSACNSYIWAAKGNKVYTTNNNTDTIHLTNIGGCDSLVTLNLTIKAATTSTSSATACGSYLWNGVTYTTSGAKTFSTTNSKGCDSTATLNLIINNPTTSTSSATACDSYSWNGVTYTTSGAKTFSTTNSKGCDSIATLNLTIVTSLPSINGADAICVGATTTLSNTISGGTWFTQATSQATIHPSTGLVTAKNAGVITIQYSKTGCGSVTKSFTVNPIPVVPTIVYAPGTPNPQIGAPTGGFCLGKVFTVEASPNVPAGSWSATGFASITNGGVVTIIGVGAGSIKYTYTSAAGCVNSRTMVGTGYTCAARGVSTSNEQLAIGNNYSIYPNPAKGFINLNVETLVGAGSIVITDLYGKTVKNQPLSLGTNTVDIANLSKGFYLVSVIANEGKSTKKLVVE